MNEKIVLGLDYGTDSVRAILVSATNGEEIASEEVPYPRWANGEYCDPAENRYRQHPADYLDGLRQSVKGVLENQPQSIVNNITGIGITTTGSTPVAVDEKGIALALKDEFKDNPNAMFVLWKDHTAVKEAAEINSLGKTWGGVDYTMYEGGIYSSEWFWSKILHVLREDITIRDQAHSWVEHCDWMPAVITGTERPELIKRSRCAAGHKAMWHESWNGLPGDQFLVKLDPLLTGLRDRLYRDTYTSDHVAGRLTEEWAGKLGLPIGIPVAVGAIDAHMGAVGAGITPYSLVKVMGTSTCDMLIAPEEELGQSPVRGICGQVDGSIIPGMIGMEAGQSAFGDIYAWFRDIMGWPLNLLSATSAVDSAIGNKLKQQIMERLIPELSAAAKAVPVEESGVIAVDWMNGRRTPDANQALKGAILNLSLGSDAPKIFRALVEATAFGARKINDRFIEEGVPIKEVIAIGGISKKSPFVMQVLADVLGMDIKVARSDQTVALGAAMFAAVAGGVHKTVEKAQEAMGYGFESVYRPDPTHAEKYTFLFERYTQIGLFIEEKLG